MINISLKTKQKTNFTSSSLIDHIWTIERYQVTLKRDGHTDELVTLIRDIEEYAITT